MVDEKEKSLEKSYNIIYFTVVSDFDKMQIDLASEYGGCLSNLKEVQLEYSREFDAVFIDFPRILKKGEQANIKVWYSGYPRQAVNAPWDGGFSWEKG